MPQLAENSEMGEAGLKIAALFKQINEVKFERIKSGQLTGHFP